MRKSFGPFLGIAQGLLGAFGMLCAVAALSGCDDSDRGKPHAKIEKSHAESAASLKVKAGGGWFLTSETPVSAWTFAQKTDPSDAGALNSLHVALDADMLPPRDSVRIAELVNHLLPVDAPVPDIVLINTPWNEDTLLLWVEAPAADSGVSIEFNPDSVAAYRPVGDPSTLPTAESGQSGTAMLYELQLPPNASAAAAAKFAVLRNSGGRTGVTDLGKPGRSPAADRLITSGDLVGNFDDAPDIVRFAAAVAGFGELLRGDPAVRDLSCGDVIALAQSASQPDPDGRRARLIDLMRRAEPLIELPSGDPSQSEGPR